MKIIVASIKRITAIYMEKVENVMLGTRIGCEYHGVDACWCSPSQYMAIGTVIINVSWS